MRIKEITKQTYTKAERYGDRAEVWVYGALRGGYLYNGKFYYYDGKGPKEYTPREDQK